MTMKIIANDDFELLKKLTSLNQNKTKEFVANILEKYYPKVVETSD